MRKIIICLISIIIIFTKISFAQFITKIPFEQLTNLKGLVSNNITAITQDDNGLLYIGTDKGLNIYDGSVFIKFDLGSDIYITCLYYTTYPQSSLWIGTWGNGLIQLSLQDNKIKKYTTSNHPFLKSNFITALTVANKKLFIGTPSGITILNFNNHHFSNKNISSILEKNKINVLTSFDNKIWIGTQSGLYILNPHTNKIQPSFINNLKLLNITALSFGKDNILWIGTNSGVYIYNIKNHSLKKINTPPSLAQSHITAIKRTSLNKIWIGTEKKGLFIIDENSKEIENIRNSSFKHYSLRSDYITEIFESYDKTIWIGTYGKGLFYYPPILENVRYISFHLNQEDKNYIHSIAKDNNGNIWIATDKGIIKKWNPINNYIHSYIHNPNDKKSITNNYITVIYPDSKGRIWIGTKKSGVELLNPERNKIIKRFKNLKDVEISDITEDKKGNIWIGSLGKGVIKISPWFSVRQYNTDNSKICSNFITKLLVDKNNHLWIGTTNGLCFYSFSQNTIKQILPSSDNLDLMWIYGIYQDPHNNIWVSTKNGHLFEITPSLEIKDITDSILVKDNVIYDISGYDNTLWMTTKKGIIRYKIDTHKKTVINKKIINIKKGYAPLLKYNSHFYTFSQNGLISFDTNIYNIDSIGPKISIKKIEINKKQIKERDNIVIKGIKNKLKIDLNTVDFLDNKLTYAYKLIGYDTSYHISKKHTLIYENIPAGKYKLLIKTINQYGKEDSTLLPTTIEVKPLFTETKLFYLLKTFSLVIVLLLIIILIMIYFINKQQRLLKIIRKKNKELEEKNSELEEKIYIIKEQSEWILKLNEELSNSYEELKAANHILKEQEAALTEQTREIMASLQYAQHIQLLLLQSSDEIQKYFKEHFIIYIPKEIISGDFFWITEINDYKIVIVGDATGHGVPGALMAILGLSIIKKIVNEYKITEPEQILNKTRSDLKSFQNKTIYDNEGFNLEREGFSLSIVKIDPVNNIIKYATAGGTSYLIDIKTKELHELKTAKRDITFAFSTPVYTQEIISYSADCMLYMFTDGYPDQIGGPQGKKLKYRRMKEILVNICSLSMEEQKKTLEDTFYKWLSYPPKDNKHPYFQIDDVTVLGIKIFL